MQIKLLLKNSLIINNNIEKLDFIPKTYLLVDEDNRVLLGNSFIHLMGDKIYCIIIKSHKLLEMSCFEFESEIVKENNLDRINSIVKEVNDYIRNYHKENNEQCFDFDLTEYRTIEETYFDKPALYNFNKGKKKKNTDVEEFNLFSEGVI